MRRRASVGRRVTGRPAFTAERRGWALIGARSVLVGLFCGATARAGLCIFTPAANIVHGCPQLIHHLTDNAKQPRDEHRWDLVASPAPLRTRRLSSAR
eukprot:scaffold2157_cov376-Prasinococcus_capsulatus_cf.AAC.21